MEILRISTQRIGTIWLLVLENNSLCRESIFYVKKDVSFRCLLGRFKTADGRQPKGRRNRVLVMDRTESGLSPNHVNGSRRHDDLPRVRGGDGDQLTRPVSFMRSTRARYV